MISRARYDQLKTAAIATLILIGSALGILAFAGLSPFNKSASAATAVPSEGPDLADAAPMFATAFLADWLEGKDLRLFASSVTASEQQIFVEEAWPIRSVAHSDGLVEVVVAVAAVTVNEDEPEAQATPLPTRFYQVAVHADADGWLTVYSDPSPIPTPALVPLPLLLVEPSLAPNAADPVITTAVTGFLDAWLTGQSEPSLYTTPGFSVPAFDTPLFTSITLHKIGIEPVPGYAHDDLVVVAVSVAATGETGSQLVTYHLVLAERDGRWEISQILPAPPTL